MRLGDNCTIKRRRFQDKARKELREKLLGEQVVEHCFHRELIILELEKYASPFVVIGESELFIHDSFLRFP